MSSELTAAMTAQLLAQQVRPAIFAEVAFETETVFIWSGLGTVTPPVPIGGSTTNFPYGTSFTGVGSLGQIQGIPEVGDVVAQNITLLLSGLDPDLLTDAINAVRQNSTCNLWFGFFDAAMNLIPDPAQVFAGALDVPTITEAADKCSISITAENPLIDLNRAPNRHFTDVDQQVDYPGDTGFSQVQFLQDYNIVWPQPAPGNGDYQPPDYLLISPAPANPSCISVAAHGTLALTCTEYDSGGGSTNITSECQWTSSDVTIATVSAAGLVSAVGQGIAVITARWNHGQYTHSDLSPSLTASVTVAVTQ